MKVFLSFFKKGVDHSTKFSILYSKKINNEYSHNGDLVIILEVMNDQIVLVSNEAAEEESEVLISELEPRSEAVRGFWNDGM